jgi:hypothetical protein
MMFQGSRGRVVLYLGNKNAYNIANLTASVAPPPGLVMHPSNPLPPGLAPKQQVQYILDASCQTPFLKPPLLTLSYSIQVDGQTVQVTSNQSK